jgi:glycosyltransferase involved in cell wall biosynthesis
LRAVLADPGARVTWGARARAHIAAHYSWERTTDDYEALFARLLASGVREEAAR